MDGATHFQAFRKVVVPLAAPGLATAGILTFIAAWNEFLLAVTLTRRRGPDRAGGDLVLHRGDRASGPVREHRGRFGGHLGTVDLARAALPEAHRGRSHGRRRQGLDRAAPERPEVEPYL